MAVSSWSEVDGTDEAGGVVDGDPLNLEAVVAVAMVHALSG